MEFIADRAARTAWHVLYGVVGVLLLWHRVLTPVWAVLPLALPHEGAALDGAPVLALRAAPARSSADHGQGRRRARRGPRRAAAGYPRVGRGSYGSLTAARRSRGTVLLIAGGAGITPLRALFETLPGVGRDLTLLYRARTAEDLALREELEAIADDRGQLLYAVNGPDGRRPSITAGMLRRILPDIARHDVDVCGRQGLAVESYAALRETAVPDRWIHHESFAF